MKPKVIIMAGLQCSGKSTIAKELSKKYNFKYDNGLTIETFDAEILSSDELRKKYPDWDNEKIFKQLYQDMDYHLSFNSNVIIDATNLSIKSRKKIFDNIKHDVEVIAYIVNTDYETCKERLIERNEKDGHKVPLEVLQRYYYSWETPFLSEGFSEIILHNSFDNIEAEDYVKHYPEIFLLESLAEDYILPMKGFDQKTPYHSLTLHKHTQAVVAYLENKGHKEFSNIVEAARFHDTGKLKTQTFLPDGRARYLSHANVGAYDLLSDSRFIIYTKEDLLDIIFIINYHMHPYNWKTEKAINKAKKTFGEYRYNLLLEFNEADKAGH